MSGRHSQPSTSSFQLNSNNSRTSTGGTATSSTAHPSILKGSGKTSMGSGDHSSDFSDSHSQLNLLTLAAASSGYHDLGSRSSVSGTPAKRRKQDPKTGKGLRHFSMKVCEKVKLKGTTTYNEVADELVAEFSADPIASRAAFTGGFLPGDAEPFDQKNIRRRVYDALNVLMAMNIISKEKKEIKWIGLPTNAAQECQELETEKEKRLERIALKKQQLRDLLLQQIAFKNLVERNKKVNPPPASNAIINLPFIVVNTDKKTVIDCSISNDKTEYLFNFDSTFEIHDDIEVLKRMGLALGLEKSNTTGLEIPLADVENARSMLAEGLRCELDEMLEEKNVVVVPTSNASQSTRTVMTHRSINNRH